MSEKNNDEKVKEILRSEKIPERLEPQNIKKMLDENVAAGKIKREKNSRKPMILKYTSIAAAAALVVGTSAYFARPFIINERCNNDKYTSSYEYAADNLQAESLSMRNAKEYKDVYSWFYAASTFNKIRDFFSFSNGFARDEAALQSSEAVYYDTAEEAADDDLIYGAGAENGANADLPAAGTTSDMSLSSEEKEYTDTYNQEEDVLEADIVKTDGTNIFYADNTYLYFTQVDKGKFKDPRKYKLDELLSTDNDIFRMIQDMYIYNNKLVVIFSFRRSGNTDYNEDSYIIDYDYPVCSSTGVAVFGFSNEGLFADGYYTQDGYYNDVRLMSDGFLYLVTNDEKYIDFDNVSNKDIEKYIPEYGVCGEYSCVEPENIMIPTAQLKDVYNYISYTNIAGLDLNSQTPWQPVDTKSIAGYTNNIYCSKDNLYVVSGYSESDITRFDLEKGTVDIAASGKVNGYVNDQFSMSEYNGYFRIAVTEENWQENEETFEDSVVMSNTRLSRKNSIYVLDMDMNVYGSISDLGIDEVIKSVNFNGDMAYVVTFRQTDPLYAIDLSDPAAPKKLDELKINGYSSYMQKWDDGLLLGFGEDANDDGRITGVKLTMFDNSDPDNLKAIDTASFAVTEEELYNGNRYIYSIGTYERKALFIHPELNLIGFPLTEDGYGEDYNGYYNDNSYRFYSYENGKLIYKGSIDGNSILKQEDHYYSAIQFNRVVYIDGYLYAMMSGGGGAFVAADAGTFAETDAVRFYEEDLTDTGIIAY